MDLKDFALQCDDVLKPFNKTETLLFYAVISKSLNSYLKGKEIAAKNWIPHGKTPFLIKRGSKEEPLHVEEFKEVTIDFLKVRSEKEHLDEAKKMLNKTQEKLWTYFLPRKLSDFFYATNNETPGKNIDRIFFDIDKGEKATASESQNVAKALLDTIDEDRDFDEIRENISTHLVSWTGNSFHVMLFLKKPMPNSFYVDNFQFSKNDPLNNFTGRWVEKIKKQGFKVTGGHEKTSYIIIDPSQTPSGKLCRVPLGSLHMKDALTVNGVSIPLKREMLEEKNLVNHLRDYTPQKVLEELNELEKRLPKL
jgi:hypothetical protein